MLLDRDTGLGSRGLSLSVGQRGEVRLQSRGARGWSQAVPLVQGGAECDQSLVRAHN